MAQGSSVKARAERFAYGNRVHGVGPWLIGKGQEIDIASHGAVSFTRRGVEFIGIECIGTPEVAL
jgi:hypothetical protein